MAVADRDGAKRAPRAKPAPRTKGTPAKPPAPRKVATPAKPRRPAEGEAQPPAPGPTAPSSPSTPGPASPGRPAPLAPNPAVARLGWDRPQGPPATAAARAPVPAPAPAPTPVPAFDPATGDWVPAGGEPAADPAQRRPWSVRTVLLTVLLALALGLLALNAVLSLLQGAILVFAEDSRIGEELRREVESAETGPTELALLMMGMLLLSGVIPFVWVLGTRLVPWEGTKRYLQLRGGLRDWLRGVALVPAMVVGVILLVLLYTVATEGLQGVTDPAEEEESIDPILKSLNWPLAIVVALAAGIGEEILYRGLLQRWLGVWWQGLVFGLAHAGNAYPPQVLFAFVLGVAFGLLRRRGWSLVTLMVAHVLYDFLVLSLALLYPDLG